MLIWKKIWNQLLLDDGDLLTFPLPAECLSLLEEIIYSLLKMGGMLMTAIELTGYNSDIDPIPYKHESSSLISTIVAQISPHKQVTLYLMDGVKL